MSCAVGVCQPIKVVRMRPFVTQRLLIPRPSLLFTSSLSRRGFGGGQQMDNNDDDKKKSVKRKRVNIRREEVPIPNQGNTTAFADVTQLEKKLVEVKDDEEFAQRLAAVRSEGQERRQQLLNSTSSASSGKASSSAAVFDSPTDIYANPPSITSTLLNQLNADVSDPKLKSAQIGPNQIAIAVSAVIFGLVFVLVSGSDFAPTKRYQGVRFAQQPPDALETSLIKGRVAQLENAREMNPADTTTLEELAVSYAQLFEFEKAANLLDTLVAARPQDQEAWRLLGETTLLSQQPARSAAAYEKAAALGGGDLQVLTGLADAYIANSQHGKAIDFLTKLKGGMGAAASAPAAASSGQGAAAEGSAPSSSEQPGAGAAGTSQAAKASTSSMDSVSLDLLMAKVYSSWRGHDSDALSTYNSLLESSPKDFRGYLAKGLYLKERGQKSDAQRMFMQARFYAPQSRQQFIEQMAGANPVLDLPSDE